MNAMILLLERLKRAALLIILLCAVGLGQSLAQTFTVGNLNYSINDDGVSVTVTGRQYATSNLVIPESVSYDGITYTVKTIGESAFNECNDFTGSLTIPNSVTTIGGWAFGNCSGFTGTLIIPESVTLIGPRAFQNTGFTTLIFEAVNCQMGYDYGWIGWEVSVFENCPLTTLNIGNNVQSIPYRAFEGLSSLTGALVIPNSVTSIGEYAFSNTGFTGNLSIPNSVTTIGEYAFSGCTGFDGTLTIGTAVTSVGPNAFQNCTGLTGIIFNATNCTSMGYYYNSNNSFDYYYSNGEYYTDDPYCYFTSAFSDCSNITMLQIGEGVQTIPNGAFRDLTGITGSFNIPNSVVTIGDYAFAETNLNGVLTIPENVTSVGLKAFAHTGVTTINFNATNCIKMGYLYWLNAGYNELAYMSAFYGCSEIEFLQIGDNVLQIPDGAFKDMSSISGTINLPNSIETIGSYAFDNIGISGTLVIPESVISIGSYAFSKNDITTVNFNATNCTEMGTGWYWSDGVDVAVSTFYSCNNLTTLNIGSGVQNIPNYAFVNCAGLTGYLSLPNSLISIGENAFFGCTGFSGDLVIPNAVETIGNNAFKDCTGLGGTLTIGESATTVHGTAFTNSNFSTMNYNATNCVIGGLVWDQWYYNQYFVNNSFSGMPLLETLNFGNNVESISQMAFKDCSTLTGTLTLPNSLTTIGDQAFYNCYGFEGIVMGNSVETIGAEAFRNCGGMRGELSLPETLQSVGNYAFASCDELTTINYNAINCTEMGNAQSPVFYDCASIEHIIIGEDVESIPNYAFKRCSTVTDMTVRTIVPPVIGSSTFGTVSRSIPVTVPYGSGEAYQSAQYWEEFFNIIEGYGPTPYTNYWHPNPHQFAFNMSVIGIIQIDGIEQTNNALEIGAFCGGDCRGSQMLTYFPQLDRYLLFLTLYGEQGDLLTFRLYDHEAGEISTLACATYITFTPNGIIGAYQNPYAFDFNNIQNAELAEGWNWFSSYVDLDGIDGVQMMTDALGENGLIIKSQSDGFVTYDGGEWVGTLTSINNENTYFINTSASCVMSMLGGFATPDQHPITLNSGWNWIGYPSVYASDLNIALEALIASDGDIIKNQDNFSIYADGYGWIGEFNTITPGLGMMYNSLNGQPVELVYSGSGRGADLAENMNSANNHWVANRHAYPYNMNIVAVVQLEGDELRDSNVELAAFAADECRGSARLLFVEHLNRYMAFLTVTGEGASQLTWKLYDSATGMEYANSEDMLQFEANGIVGSLDNPLVVDFSSLATCDETFGSLVSLYPNPAKAGDKVRIDMPIDSKARVEVVNAMGAVLSAETLTGLSESIRAPRTSGVYVVKVTIEGQGTYAYKLIVE